MSLLPGKDTHEQSPSLRRQERAISRYILFITAMGFGS